MSNFIKIVKNYEYLGKLGKEIINHNKYIKHIMPLKLDEEFKNQENRIEEFIKLRNKTEENWNSYFINKYWTGPS